MKTTPKLIFLSSLMALLCVSPTSGQSPEDSAKASGSDPATTTESNETGQEQAPVAADASKANASENPSESATEDVPNEDAQPVAEGDDDVTVLSRRDNEFRSLNMYGEL